MKHLQPILIIFLLIGCVFGQEQDTIQTEEMDIAKIKEKAKTDAETDFNGSSKLRWGGGSCLLSFGSLSCAVITASALFLDAISGIFSESEGDLSEAEETQYVMVLGIAGIVALVGPPAAALLFQINIPEYREKEIVSKSEKYQTVYRSAYKSQIFSKRFGYSLIGPTILIITALVG